MRILAIYRHYVPDAPPYARILRTIVESQAAKHHDVTVLTAQPAYNDVRQVRQPRRETINGVAVRRVRLLPERKTWRAVRALNFVWFLLRAVIHATFAGRYDLIVAGSHPPVLMGCALRAIQAITGTPYIYHCQDLHPEAAVLGGDLKRGKLFRRLVRWDTATCTKSLRTVVLSRDMANTLVSRGVATERLTIVNNPPLPFEASVRPMLPPPLDERTDVVRFLFAGNLGRFQGLERLIAAARLIAGRVPYQLVFMGEGSAKRELIELAGELMGRRIVFVPQQPVEVAAAAMRTADYGVVSLLAGMYRFAYPSKTMMYWSAGSPVVALVEPQCELAQTIRRHDLGCVPESRSVSHVAEMLLKAVIERASWTPERRGRIARTCERLYGQEAMLEAWDRIIAGDTPDATTMRDLQHASKAA